MAAARGETPARIRGEAGTAFCAKALKFVPDAFNCDTFSRGRYTGGAGLVSSLKFIVAFGCTQGGSLACAAVTGRNTAGAFCPATGLAGQIAGWGLFIRRHRSSSPRGHLRIAARTESGSAEPPLIVQRNQCLA